MSVLKMYGKKTAYLLVSILVSLLFSYFFQPLLTNDALDVLVNIYSILAGFLIGVIALIGDPSSLPSGSWRIAELATKNTFRLLKGTRNLLYVYLMTLLLIFMYKLLSIDQLMIVLNKLNNSFDFESYLFEIKVFGERLILLLSFLAFFYSFKLPSTLFNT